jgi:hypothetical protein
VRTAWPATRPAHSFLKLRAYPLNVLPSGFRFLNGDSPADPLIAREWRNILPFCPRHRVRNENLSQIRWYTVHRSRGDRFLGHGFHSTSLPNQSGESLGCCPNWAAEKSQFGQAWGIYASRMGLLSASKREKILGTKTHRLAFSRLAAAKANRGRHYPAFGTQISTPKGTLNVVGMIPITVKACPFNRMVHMSRLDNS